MKNIARAAGAGLALLLAARPNEHMSKTSSPQRPRTAQDQLDLGRAFFARLGMDVSYFDTVWPLLKVSQLLMADLNRISMAHGIGIADFHLLGALLIARPEPLRATDLALSLNVSNAVLTGRVRKLAKAGLLVREYDYFDRRIVILRITPEGEARVRAIGDGISEASRFVQHVNQLPAQEREGFERTLRRLHQAMERDFLPAGR